MPAKSNLSKNVLQMKFMQRSVLRIEREQNEEEQQRVIDDEHWVLDLQSCKTKEDKYQKGLGYVFCEELESGRQSYKGFNPDIEKLMTSLKQEEEIAKFLAKEKLNSVSDEDMAHRYSSLMGIVAKKFAKKRDRGQMSEDEESDGPAPVKRTFMKPVDD